MQYIANEVQVGKSWSCEECMLCLLFIPKVVIFWSREVISTAFDSLVETRKLPNFEISDTCCEELR